jgi:uncharacterized radical SAM superfamily Fe-S cluster-containing enzyme
MKDTIVICAECRIVYAGSLNKNGSIRIDNKCPFCGSIEYDYLDDNVDVYR